MKIVVCVKQVPDTTEIKINPETGTLIRDGVPSILNPDDANALEQALEIKDSQPDTEVVVVTMGPPQAKEMLRECLAMGADDAVLARARSIRREHEGKTICFAMGRHVPYKGMEYLVRAVYRAPRA